ncbi:MAG: energy transducer TonB [Acidobacteriota bacterium]|nr:MAG: energy transducer TonB [Acidobacteriota bacterium]
MKTTLKQQAKLLASSLCLFLAAVGGAWCGEMLVHPPEQRFSYHLRVVRVSGATAYPGAAIGAGQDRGVPIVMPEDEAWGSAKQLAALADTLGGERADAVTGFFLSPSDEGEAQLERTFYAGEEAVSLSFLGRVLETDTGHAHELTLRLSPTDDPSRILAEAVLLARTDRTVAIAAPSPLAGEWIVLAVTSLDTEQYLAKVEMPPPPPKGAPPSAAAADEVDDVEMPVMIERVSPRYPPTARRQGRQGRVILQLVIDEQGVPRAPVVLEVPEDGEDFAAAAVEAILQWRYEPARRDGKPVPVLFTTTVKFALE